MTGSTRPAITIINENAISNHYRSIKITYGRHFQALQLLYDFKPGKFVCRRSSKQVVRLIHETHLCRACAKNLSRRFFASLPLKSKSFMQYAA